MNIFNSVESFLEKIFLNLGKDGINVSAYELDHICYRVETLQQYDKLKKELDKIADLLRENKVRERFIATYKLHKPIIFRDRKIDVIEIPQPSDHISYKTGWQHAEFVIDESFESFMSKYPKVKFTTDGMQKEVNPELKVVWSDYTVKFHHQSIEYVVKQNEQSLAYKT